MEKKTNDVRSSWERFVDPDQLRTNLIFGSIYVTAFEMLKDAIIDRLKWFYSSGMNEDGPIVDEAYAEKVLSLNKSQLYASLAWLQGMSAIDENDLIAFERIKQWRNLLAHEMMSTINHGIDPECKDCLQCMVELLRKVETWWLINVDCSIDSDLCSRNIIETDVLPGSVIALSLMCSIALGDDTISFPSCEKQMD